MTINVAEQLFPNWLTVLTQLCATAVLFLFVRKFFWSVGCDIIKKRQDLMQSRLSEADRYRSEAKLNRELSDKELLEVQNKAKEMLDNARKEADAEKERIIDEANRIANASLEKANITIEKQRLELRKDLTKEIVDVAFKASSKLLGEKDLSSYEQDALEAFVKEYNDEGDS